MSAASSARVLQRGSRNGGVNVIKLVHTRQRKAPLRGAGVRSRAPPDRGLRAVRLAVCRGAVPSRGRMVSGVLGRFV